MTNTASLRHKLLELAVSGKLIPRTDKWSNVRFADICKELNVGIVIKPTRYYVKTGGYKAFRNANVKPDSIDDSDWALVSEKAAQENPRCIVHTNDVLIARSGAPGVAAPVPKEFDGYVAIDVLIATPRHDVADSKFLSYFINSPTQQQKISGMNRGVALSHIGVRTIGELRVNLPPLAEQKAIVRRLEELLALEREIAADSAALDDLVAAAKRKILGLAISGKLVPKMGVWQTCSFEELVNFRMGKTPPRADRSFWDPAKYPWVSISDMIPGGIVVSTKEAVSEKAATELLGGRISKAGTLIMSFKLTIGRVSVLGVDAYHNEAIISIFPKDDTSVDRDYLKLILPLVAQDTKSSPAVMGNTLNKNSIARMPIPLPPLAEQKAIVARVEELHAVLDAIID